MAVSISIWRPTISVRRLAGRTVLLQVVAESRQFAVWHQEEARQAASYQRSDRAGDAPLRLFEVYPSLKHWLPHGVLLPVGPGKSDSLLFGVKEPDCLLSFFMRPLSQALALHTGKCGKNVVCLSGKDAEEPETICYVGSSRV